MSAQSIWTHEQREAITAALDGGMTSREVAAAATAGELAFQGAPVRMFDVTAKQASGIARRVRAQRPPGDRAKRIEALNERMLKWAERAVRALEKTEATKGARLLTQLAMGIGRIQENERAADGFRARPRGQESLSPSPMPPDPPAEPAGALLQAMRGLERPILPAQRAPLAPVLNAADPDDQAVA